jgi:hypothetical protein
MKMFIIFLVFSTFVLSAQEVVLKEGQLHIKKHRSFSDDKTEYLYIGYAGLNVYGTQPSGPWESIDDLFNKYDAIGAAYKSGHMMWARPNAKAAVIKWMSEDKTRGGRFCRNIILHANSWGALNSTVLARWFESEYGIKARLHMIIEGVSRNSRPYNHIGPATESINIYSKDKHWPRGAAIAEADQNIAIKIGSTAILGNHINAEWIGKRMVEKKIGEMLKSKNTNCDH